MSPPVDSVATALEGPALPLSLDGNDGPEECSAPVPSTQIVIEAGRGAAQYWRDLWRYRELLYFLAWRDIVVHYKQTLIGVAWALLRPLATVMVFVLVFSKLAGLPSDGVPYPLLVLAAMLPWQLFANALTQCGGSLLINANLVSKVYFPRLLLPMSAVAVSLVDFLITLAALAGLMAWYGVAPSWRVLTLPFFVALAAALALGVGLWLAALSVRYRDIRHLTPFLVQFGLYLSPVGFSSSVVPAPYRLLFGLNPMVGVIDGFRWAILDTAPLDGGALLLSLLLIALALTAGIWFFRKTERTFADVI
jgi:lipopolysaccharide transport system permease protein